MDHIFQLTRREYEVLDLVGAGLSDKEIAERLVIEPSTVQNHLYRIYDKLDVSSRIQAALKAEILIYAGRQHAQE